MSRERSEYRLHPLPPFAATPPPHPIRHVERTDRSEAARLLLAAYRDTVDDEGEGDAEALEAIDDYFTNILWPHSFVMLDDGTGTTGGTLVAMSLVVVVDERHYIDPVATDASHKGRGIGRRMVVESLRSLAAHGVDEVGATITDGNVPSERLFAGLGFQRVGAWL